MEIINPREKYKNDIDNNMNNLHIMIRGELFIVPSFVAKQSPFLNELLYPITHKVQNLKTKISLPQQESPDNHENSLDNSDKIITLNYISPIFFKHLMDYFKNEYKIQFFKQILDKEFDEEKIKHWLGYLALDNLYIKMYVSLPQVIYIPVESELINANENQNQNQPNDYNLETRKIIVELASIIEPRNDIVNCWKAKTIDQVYVLNDGSFYTKPLKKENTVRKVNANKIIIDNKIFYTVKYSGFSGMYDKSPTYQIPGCKIIEYNGLFYMRMEDYLTCDFSDKDKLKSSFEVR